MVLMLTPEQDTYVSLTSIAVSHIDLTFYFKGWSLFSKE